MIDSANQQKKDTSMIDFAVLRVDEQSLQQVLKEVDLLAAHTQRCDDFVVLFGRHAENNPTPDTSQFLAAVCGMRLRSDSPENPLAPAFELADCRTPTWSDITATQLQAIAAVVMTVANVELMGRLADILWLRERSHQHARLAADAYWSSGRDLVMAHQALGERARLTRALQLAASVGKNDGLFNQLVDNISNLMEGQDVLDCSVATCMDILLHFQCGDSSRLHEYAKARAVSHVDESRNAIWERRFWHLAARFARRSKDHEADRMAMIEVAKTFEWEAEHAQSQLVASSFWKQAVHIYRSIPDTANERERAHAKLIEAQQRGCSEFITRPVQENISPELTSASRDRVKGKNKWEALATLVCAWRIPSRAKIQAEAETSILSQPLAFLFPIQRLSSTGKTTAHTPSHVGGSSEVSKELIDSQACELLECEIAVVVNGVIRPMRQEIDLQHAILLEDIRDFLQYSPIIPVDRFALFVVGIHAGLHGRFIEATHILLPQLEHLLRCLLEANGVRTSTLDDEGIQEEFDINRLFHMKETESLLGEDLCYCLRVLLVERHGAMTNLRNRMAHGMLSSSAFFTDNVVFTWWLIWRLVGGEIAESILINTKKEVDQVDD